MSTDNPAQSSTLGNVVNRDPVTFAFLLIVLFVAFFALYQSKAPAPVPAPVAPAPAPYVPPPAPSPCGPNNRCPYRQTAPFTAACPYCRNYIVAYPAPIDGRWTFDKYVPGAKGAAPKK